MNRLNKRIGQFFNQPLLQNPAFLAAVWMGSILVLCLLKIKRVPHNNYLIFSHSFWHALSQTSLYEPYPHEYRDLYLYGPSFTALIAPFALLPDYIGVIFWCLANSLLLFWALRKMNFVKWKFAFIIWFSVNELYVAEIARQFNTGIAALVILSFVLIEQKKDFWAALTIMLGTMTKIYGIVGLAFIFFSKRKLHLLWGLLFWGIVLFTLPMLFSSPHFVFQEYGEWLHTLVIKNGENMFCSYTNVSLLGMVRKITHCSTYSDLWIIIPGFMLFLSPYFRFRQYDFKNFRLLFLSSTLLFMVLFSTGTEKCGYIGAMVATAIWYVSSPTRKKSAWINISLLILCFILSMNTSDLFPKYLRKNYIVPYALKALPFVLVWLKVEWELLTQNFEDTSMLKPKEISSLDIVLPCYNPRKGWEKVMIDKYVELKKILQIGIRFIVVNDGSTSGFTDAAVDRLEAALPNTLVVNNQINHGKGSAVRSGLSYSDSDIILYTDYDFPYRTESVSEVVSLLKRGYDVVIARRNRTYYNHLNFRRKLMSHASRLLNFFLLGLSHDDTQGGLKGFNRQGKKYIESTDIDSFLFDTEFVYRASLNPGVTISETPVDLRDDIVLSEMHSTVMRKEMKNLISIAWKG